MYCFTMILCSPNFIEFGKYETNIQELALNDFTECLTLI